MSKFTSKTFLALAALTVAAGIAAPSQAFARDNDHRWDNNDHHDNNWNNNNHDNGWHGNPHTQPRVVYVQPRQSYYYFPQQAYGYSQPVYIQPRPVHYIAPNYYVGRRLSYYQPVPQTYIQQLSPCPRGYYYSYQDQNVFLVRQNDNVIEQVLSLLLR